MHLFYSILNLAGNYLLQFLANRGPRLAIYAQTAIIGLLCRITKFAWFDSDPKIREIVDDASQFLSSTLDHCVIGLRLLNALVEEINYPQLSRTFSQHRRVAVSFRDTCLLKIFEIALTMLNQLATRAISFSNLPSDAAERMDETLLDQSLTLLLKCLRYNFIGVNTDESLDDSSSIQVPASWRDKLQSGSPLRLLFNIYRGATTSKIPLIPDQEPPVVQPDLSAAPRSASGKLSVSALASASHYSSAAAASKILTRDFRSSRNGAIKALESLSLLISIRDSIFSNVENRKRYISTTLKGVSGILRDQQGLSDPDCFHRFCQLLSKIKANTQLLELITTEGYAEWLDLVAQFTLTSCNRPLWAGNSIHYILNLWSRLVTSVPYARTEYNSVRTVMSTNLPSATEMLEEYVPKIIGAFIHGRIEALQGPEAEEAMEALNDLEVIEDQLEQLPILARFKYSSTTSVITYVFDPLVSKYMEGRQSLMRSLTSQVNVDPKVMAALKLLECQLSWVVAVIGAIVGGALSSGLHGSALLALISSGNNSNASSTPADLSDEAYDADLIKRVLSLSQDIEAQITTIAGQRAPVAAAQDPSLRMCLPDERLELSLLYFYERFRRAYISESGGMPKTVPSRYKSKPEAPALLASAAMASTKGESAMGDSDQPPTETHLPSGGKEKMFLQMFGRMEMGDHLRVTAFLVTKLASNLRWWGNKEEVISRSLEVLHSLVQTYSSGKLLLALPEVSQLLTHHGPDNFPFLYMQNLARYRTKFYASLTRLVFFESDSENFEPFAQPLLSVLDQLNPHVGSRNEEVMNAIIGACRDWRGIISSAVKENTYRQVFEALHPNHLATFARIAEVWADSPQVTTPLLKMILEFATQRLQRIKFGNNSPNGILLVRAVSAILVAYCSRIESVSVTHHHDPYAVKYKGVMLSAAILSAMLDGEYANFGVLTLYGDNALTSAMSMVLKAIFSIPLDAIQVSRLSICYIYFSLTILCYDTYFSCAFTLLFHVVFLYSHIQRSNVKRCAYFTSCSVAISPL